MQGDGLSWLSVIPKKLFLSASLIIKHYFGYIMLTTEENYNKQYELFKLLFIHLQNKINDRGKM